MEEEKNGYGFPLHYWLHWQVLLSSLIFLLPAVLAVILIRRRLKSNLNPLNSTQLWFPCWRFLHPRWLLFYRAFAFLSMAFFLYQIVLAVGFFVFFFYTQYVLFSFFFFFFLSFSNSPLSLITITASLLLLVINSTSSLT